MQGRYATMTGCAKSCRMRHGCKNIDPRVKL